LIEGGSRSASELARELGVRRNQLYKWQREFQARGTGAFPGSGARKERTTEIIRLKRELARVTEERDILKKAAMYFAKESP
jgi:transposase